MKINELIGKMKRDSSGTYTANDSGELLRLVPVDRTYGHKKKPVYYLQKIRNSKAEYVFHGKIALVASQIKLKSIL